MLSASILFLQHAIHIFRYPKNFLLAFFVAVAKSGPLLPSGVGIPTFVRRPIDPDLTAKELLNLASLNLLN